VTQSLGIPEVGQNSGRKSDRRVNAIVVLVVGLLVFATGSQIIPVRSEPSGWYYYDNRGCTEEYRVGTGPTPNATADVGMYYNMWGGPIGFLFPTNHTANLCDEGGPSRGPSLRMLIPILVLVAILLVIVAVLIPKFVPPEEPK